MGGWWRLRVAEAASTRRRAVLTRPFLLVLLFTFLGFAIEHALRPVIPLVVIDRGGDAVIVGLIAGVHSLPSILLRPMIGRLADRGRLRHLLQIAAGGVAVGPLGVLLPGLLPLVPVRAFQGSAWATYSVTAHALLARLAPARQRGEASGYFNAMPAVSHLVMPALGVALYTTTGEVAVIALACALGVVAVVVGSRLPIPRVPGPVESDTRTSRAKSTSWIWRFVEPSAVPATVMIATFMAAQAIFTTFAPIYALAVGAPIESLVLYYPIFGLSLTVSQLVAGTVSDRIGRAPTIWMGCGIAIIGLVIAGLGGGIPSLTLGAATYAVGVSLVSPTVSAITMDRAPAERLGSAMATFSLGYQLSTGGSSLVWGAVIAAGGFGWAFAVAIGFLFVTLVTSARWARAQ